MSQARVVQVIETTDLRGRGTPGDPMRRVLQWWTLDGKLVSERDTWLLDTDEGERAMFDRLLAKWGGHLEPRRIEQPPPIFPDQPKAEELPEPRHPVEGAPAQ